MWYKISDRLNFKKFPIHTKIMFIVTGTNITGAN